VGRTQRSPPSPLPERERGGLTDFHFPFACLTRKTKDPFGRFGTVLFYKIQLNFINFVMKQLNLKVDRVDCSVYLVDQFQFHENKIWVGVVPYTLKMMF
jgi:hypothetical protein